MIFIVLVLEYDTISIIYIICIILGISALILEHSRFTYIVILLLSQATLIFIVTSILMLIGRNMDSTEKTKES